MILPFRGMVLGLVVPALALAQQLHVSVTNKSGDPVLDLPQSAFHVFVGRAEQPIRSLQQQQTPLSIGLVVDNGPRMLYEYSARARALASVAAAADPRDEIFLAQYSIMVHIEPFTSDKEKLEKESAVGMESYQGWPLMREALSKSIDYAAKKAKNPARIVFLLAASDDASSSIKPDMLIQQARAGGVTIDAIGLLKGAGASERKSTERTLRALAEDTGGTYFYSGGIGQSDEIILRTLHRLREEYLIGCDPLPGQPTVVVDRPDLTVHILSSK